MENPEFFGNEFQVSLQKKCLEAWPALQQNSKINFSGRNFGWDNPTLADVEAIAELANQFGFIATFFTAKDKLQPLVDSFTSRQLAVEVWQHFKSIDSAGKLCDFILENTNLKEYRLELIDQATPATEVNEFQAVMQACGMAPLPGYVLRGHKIKSVAVMVKAADDSIAATALGVLRHHPKGQYQKAAHVGYLATKPEHRRKGLAKIALAKVNQMLIKKHGVELMHTGIKVDNVASKRTCEVCGLDFDGETYLLDVFQKKITGEEQYTR
jgi:predicted acetyltransferase